jgi:hypothetical protein
MYMLIRLGVCGGACVFVFARPMRSRHMCVCASVFVCVYVCLILFSDSQGAFQCRGVGEF